MKIREYKILSDYKEVTPVCKSIRSFCLEEDFKLSDCNEIEICLIEALNNIIRHAYKEDFTKNIEIDVKISGSDLEIRLADTGIPRKNFSKPKLEFDPKDIENLPEGGMGLYIIDQLMDEIFYNTNNGINIFHMKKRFSKPAAV